MQPSDIRRPQQVFWNSKLGCQSFHARLNPDPDKYSPASYLFKTFPWCCLMLCLSINNALVNSVMFKHNFAIDKSNYVVCTNGVVDSCGILFCFRLFRVFMEFTSRISNRRCARNSVTYVFVTKLIYFTNFYWILPLFLVTPNEPWFWIFWRYITKSLTCLPAFLPACVLTHLLSCAHQLNRRYAGLPSWTK